ncbi:MAG: GNAT family N-acetyltransferase [Pseudomonadota bacterium]
MRNTKHSANRIGWALRPAGDADRVDILALEEAGIRYAAEALWGNWRPSSSPEALELTGHEMVVDGAEILGCIQTLEEPGHVQIAKLYLAPQAQGHGIGAALLDLKKGLAAAKSQKLCVRGLTTNPRARAFYEREGFHLIKETAERWFWEWTPNSAQVGPVTKD